MYGHVIAEFSRMIQGGGGGVDELVNRSNRDLAADDLGHRDVTRNVSRELYSPGACVMPWEFLEESKPLV